MSQSLVKTVRKEATDEIVAGGLNEGGIFLNSQKGTLYIFLFDDVSSFNTIRAKVGTLDVMKEFPLTFLYSFWEYIP